jgi:GT2 family glycosyltransferase/spore maturation protein CgeB
VSDEPPRLPGAGDQAADLPGLGPAPTVEQVRRLEQEVALRSARITQLAEELRDLRRQARTTERKLESQTRQLELAQQRAARLRRRPLVGPALVIETLGIRIARSLRDTLVSVRARRARGRMAGQGRHRLRATSAEASAMQARLAAALVPSDRMSGPLVTAIVLTHRGLPQLRRLLSGLDRLAYRDLEIVVVDNASTDGTARFLADVTLSRPLRTIRNADNAAFSLANNQGAADANGELLLFLNDDVEPAGPHVLGHMVARLEGDPSLVALSARLVYPRRAGPREGPASRAPDLTLQHRGIGFVTRDGGPLARNLGGGEDPLGPAASTPRELEAATAACLLVRRSAFDAVGGFTTGYQYGSEDVDLCLKLTGAGGRIVYEPQATFWHHESATQYREDQTQRQRRQAANRALLADRFGPRISRAVLLDRLAGEGRWSETPLHVAVTLTRDDPNAGWGDWSTAHELGDALATLGWRVSYLERHKDRWYEPDATVDLVVSLLDAFDVRRLPDGVVTVAWVRNWTDRWLGRPWFDEYDLVFASSRRSKELIDARSVHVAGLMPLATNPERFRSSPVRDDPTVDVLFTGNRWGEEREIEAVLPSLAAAGRRVVVYGKGWEDKPAIAPLAHGWLPYDRLPAAYASASLVIDDTASPTRPYAAVNARVFDALATGTLVVTDNVDGAAELFGDRLPAASDPVAIANLAQRWIDDPAGRRNRALELQALVREQHTYRHRADQLRDALAAWAARPRIDLLIGANNWEVAETWGDYHFARGFQRALQRRDHPTRVRLRDSWEGPGATRADAAVHIMGRGDPPMRHGQLMVLWIISHADLRSDEAVADYDVVFAASNILAAHLAARLGRPAYPLHQATDAVRFRPTPGGPHHDLLFVANSRGVRRRVVDELTPTNLDLAVYGHGWTPELLDPRYLRGEHIPNQELAAYYSAAAIVLNDHWPDMIEVGLLSNRLYDAAASGAFVISDSVAGLEAEFDAGIVSFADGTELRELVAHYLAAPDERAACAARAQRAVLDRHTFDHRAAAMLEVIEPLLDPRTHRPGAGGTRRHGPSAGLPEA